MSSSKAGLFLPAYIGWGFFHLPSEYLFLRNAPFPGYLLCERNIRVSIEADRAVRLC